MEDWSLGNWSFDFSDRSGNPIHSLDLILNVEKTIVLAKKLTEDDFQEIDVSSVIKTEEYVAVACDDVGATLSISHMNNAYSAIWRQNGVVCFAEKICRNDKFVDCLTRRVERYKEEYKYVYQPELVAPRMITLLPTYRCNAACAQCCFESNPRIKHRLSLSEMIDRVNAAVDAFPEATLLVVSGGECFLLGDDLIRVLKLASSRGLYTRCVTNGFWGRSKKTARRIVNKLIDAGLREINFSTGKDHQKWVAPDHVIQAAGAVANAGIPVVVTVEADDDDHVGRRFVERSDVRELMAKTNFTVQFNAWMPFQQDAAGRGDVSDEGGCDQLFNNVVITPHDMMSACCGLTIEHIPEMKLAYLRDAVDIRRDYQKQLDDFLKIWIHMDGPTRIMERLFGKDVVDEELSSVNHICQSCAILHKHPGVRRALEERYLEFVPEVLARFNIKRTMDDVATNSECLVSSLDLTWQGSRLDGG